MYCSALFVHVKDSCTHDTTLKWRFCAWGVCFGMLVEYICSWRVCLWSAVIRSSTSTVLTSGSCVHTCKHKWKLFFFCASMLCALLHAFVVLVLACLLEYAMASVFRVSLGFVCLLHIHLHICVCLWWCLCLVMRFSLYAKKLQVS